MVATDYVGDGYGIPTAGALEAIAMFAELEGILLDPVYSAKGAAGMIDLIRKCVHQRPADVCLSTQAVPQPCSGMILPFGIDAAARRLQVITAL